MPGYNSATQVYYCKQSGSPSLSNRIAPSPTITISPEIYYANDSVVGYTYNITLSGYANALRKEIDGGSTLSGVDETVSHIGDIRSIFSFNGGNLYIKQGNNNILVAKGATIKSIQFETSDNRWVNYAPFTIQIEFNEVDFTGCSNNSSIGCGSSFFHAGQPSSIVSDDLIDMRDYKIKQFTDKWTVTIENQIYDNFFDTYNNIFRVSYDLSATGKHYYVNDTVVPAWQQAKLFCQKRLHDQVMGLLDGILQIDASSSCNASKSIDELHSIDNSGSRDGGAMSGFVGLQEGIPNQNIYNETITCNVSEANGTFSLVYSAIVKKYNPLLSPSENAVIHTATNNTTTTDTDGQNTTIAIQGNIQGLVRGGFIYQNNDFMLPDSGTFISTVDSAETKYSNALAYFNAKIGDGNGDLSAEYKTNLGITAANLLITSTKPIKPSSFTIDHNYTNGVVGYNATYDSKTAQSSGRGYSNISIVRNDPVEIIQEFIVPGRSAGPIIQKLGMKTARTISINIEGASDLNKECPEGGVIEDVCNSLPVFDIEGFEALLADSEGYVRTKEDYTSNKIDGSFSISLEYTCKG